MSGTATVPGGGTQYGYYGLTYSAAQGFIGLNVNDFFSGIGLDQISADGNVVTPITNTIYPLYTIYAAGNLSYGPDGGLYAGGRSTSFFEGGGAVSHRPGHRRRHGGE